MFIERIDKLLSEFQQCVSTKSSIPWGWIFTKLVALLSRYPTGVTKAIMFAELQNSWRKIEKMYAKQTTHTVDSLRSVVKSKHISPQAVFEVFLKEVKIVEGTHTRIAVIEECERNPESSTSSAMEMFLHQKLYHKVDAIMASGYKLRFTGCRLFVDRRKKSLSLLPSDSFVVVVNDGVDNFCPNFATLDGLDQINDPQHINSIVKVKVSEIAPQKFVHYQNGNTSNRIIVVVTDDAGIFAKLELWEEHLVIGNLFEEGDTLYIEKCFIVPDKEDCFMLEYSPETIIFCQPRTHEQEILPSQKDGTKLLYISKDNKGMLDCFMYPERLCISEIKQNMTNIVLAGKVVFVGARTLLRGEGILGQDLVKYEIRIEDESGVCTTVVVEPYKAGRVVCCGQFVLMKNLHVSSGYTMGLTLDLNTDKDGELWNLSSLQGWLSASSLCSITSIASLDPECSHCIVKGMITRIQSKDRDDNVIRVHCSCQGLVIEDMDGKLKCDNCQAKGMAEMPVNNNALKLFSLDSFWRWQYSLRITIMESDHHQLQATITNEVGEKLLQLSAGQLQALGSDGQRRVFEYTLGQKCLYGLSNFNGDLLVSVVNQI